MLLFNYEPPQQSSVFSLFRSTMLNVAGILTGATTSAIVSTKASQPAPLRALVSKKVAELASANAEPSPYETALGASCFVPTTINGVSGTVERTRSIQYDFNSENESESDME
jgi:hypothetical protein